MQRKNFWFGLVTPNELHPAIELYCYICVNNLKWHHKRQTTSTL